MTDHNNNNDDCYMILLLLLLKSLYSYRCDAERRQQAAMLRRCALDAMW